MKLNKTDRNHSDFWLEEFEVGGDNSTDTARLIKLSMARRAVSNFVNILTGKPIPVVFNENNQSLTDGQVVLLSADIASNKDFDSAVGLSLHEGSHILLTDFRILHDMWQKVPRDIYKIAEPKGFSKTDVISHVGTIFNVIEDRYIDRFVYSTAPGYRGYYQSLYRTYWHSDKITTMLKSPLYRSNTVESYEVRIINITNPATDLDALPGLREIDQIIDIFNINRLKTTDDRFQVALKVMKVIYENVDKIDEEPSDVGGPQSLSVDGSNSENKDNSKNSETDDNVDDILGGGTGSVDSSANEKSKDKAEKENEDSGISKTNRAAIDRALERQKNFINGSVKKKKVTKKENRTLTQLEKAGVAIVNVGKLLIEGQPLTKGVDCILIKNLTRELLFSDQFPCKYYGHNNIPMESTLEAVNKGIQLGVLLGRRLKIRSEINDTKYMRKSTGKIDRRILSELGFDNENVFYRLDVDKYRKAFIHISLDASSSMGGAKWISAITSVTAICKAASMIDNIHVSVSIRSTTSSGGSGLPFVAIVYDSSKDSFVKVRTLFPFLSPYGTTPEGLCYEAIMNTFGNKSADEDYYFLNFSDGEPCYEFKAEVDSTTNSQVIYSYDQKTGAKHTRRQVNEIRNRGYKVLSYFINSSYRPSVFNGPNEQCFKTMYGQDARFIDVTNVVGIARTMNQMFLEKIQKI